jgi:hypothetical protein
MRAWLLNKLIITIKCPESLMEKSFQEEWSWMTLFKREI